MRPYIALLAMPLAGCISFASEDLGKLPQDASGGMYTSLPPQGIAECIARAIGGTLQAQGDSYVVNSTRRADLSYVIGPNPRKGVYPTQVAVRGDTPASEETQAAALCLTS